MAAVFHGNRAELVRLLRLLPSLLAGPTADPTGASKSVRVQLTAANTASLDLGWHTYDVSVVLSNGSAVTLVRGRLLVLDSMRS